MKLVSTVSYKFKINGFLSKTIVPQRGLRQGDPLSPYLFILAADALSYMFENARNGGLIHGLKLTQNTPTLTHLFFADDALLFAEATDQEMFQIVKILNDYCGASGQKINVQKSSLICGRLV